MSAAAQAPETAEAPGTVEPAEAPETVKTPEISGLSEASPAGAGAGAGAGGIAEPAAPAPAGSEPAGFAPPVLLAQPDGLAAACGPYDRARMVRVQDFEAPFTLDEARRDAYLRRFGTLFLADGTARSGGAGRIVRAANAWGETVAVKLLALEGRQDAFRREYECHRALSGLKGFPRLFGCGQVDGVPAIVMEWVDGLTLEAACRHVAVDDEGRLSPLTAARMGRDLFDVLSRMELVDGGFSHGDVTRANVMVRTSHLPLAEQVEEGVFDLVLVDFGLARHPAGDAAEDVRAAGRVLRELLCGDAPDAPAAFAHRAAADVRAVLPREPEVAVAVAHAGMECVPAPTNDQVREALCTVDAQLEDVLEAACAQDARQAGARALRDALGLFCAQYAENVRLALQGEAPLPCAPDALARKLGVSPARMRNVLRVAGKALAASVWVVAVAATALLVDGAQAGWWLPWGAGGQVWQGALPAPAVAGALAAPAVLAVACRARSAHTLPGFLRGTAFLALGAAAACACLSGLQPDLPAVGRGLAAAVFATTAAAWFFLVMDFALAPARPRVRKELPRGGE